MDQPIHDSDVPYNFRGVDFKQQKQLLFNGISFYRKNTMFTYEIICLAATDS